MLDHAGSMPSARLALARSEKSANFPASKFWKRGGGYHGGVVGGERGRGEIDGAVEFGSARRGPQAGVGSHAAGDTKKTAVLLLK